MMILSVRSFVAKGIVAAGVDENNYKWMLMCWIQCKTNRSFPHYIQIGKGKFDIFRKKKFNGPP